MVSRHLDSTLQRLRDAALARRFQDAGDRELLAAFTRDRDGAAFEALVRRHGPMVWGVCRRTLRHTADAEDAFQAVFLVLVRKAGTLRAGDRLAGWLYGVALRVARKARAAARRRRDRVAAVPVSDLPGPPAEWSDTPAVVDEEVDRLPGPYREAVILCELQGRPRAEVARLLGVPAGTLSSRLAAARKLLAGRLARRGLSIPAAGLGTWLAAESAGTAISPELVAAAVSLPSPGTLSPAVALLAREGISTVGRGLGWAVGGTVLAAAVAGGLLYLPREGGAPTPPPAVAVRTPDPDPPPVEDPPPARPDDAPPPREIVPDLPEPTAESEPPKRPVRVPPREIEGVPTLARLADEADRILVVKRPVAGEVEWRVARTLKGPDRSGRSNELRVPAGYDPLPDDDPDREWVVFLRSEDEADILPPLQPVCRRGWFRPADAASVDEVAKEVGLPAAWGEAVTNGKRTVRLGMRVREAELPAGGAPTVELTVQNVGAEAANVARFRYDFFARWYVQFVLTGPDGRRWRLLPPGEGRAADLHQYQLLRPRQAYTHAVRLDNWCAVPDEPAADRLTALDFWPDCAGAYRLEAHYGEGAPRWDGNTWVGTLVSNTVGFTCRPTAGGPSRKWELLRAADRFFLTLRDTTDALPRRRTTTVLHVRAGQQWPGRERSEWEQSVKPEQARQLIEALDRLGTISESVTPVAAPPRGGEHYVVVSFGLEDRRGRRPYSAIWPWDTRLIDRAKALRACVDGDAAVALDAFLRQLEGARR